MKYDMLFRVEARVPHGKKMHAKGQLIEKVDSFQRAIVVRDLERIIVQNINNVFLRYVDVPAVWMCPEHGSLNAEDARRSGACVAVSTGIRDEYTLLWGAGDDSDSEPSQDEDETGYETAPIASVYRLLEKYLSADNSQADDSWFAGGLMERLSSHMNRNDSAGASIAAREHARFHTHIGKKLQFVYDLVASDSEFTNLRFVLDAARPPFTGAAFEKVYGLPRYLQFDMSSDRATECVDIWAGIYG